MTLQKLESTWQLCHSVEFLELQQVPIAVGSRTRSLITPNKSGEMSDQDYNIDTTGDHGARIQSIHAIPSNARSCMTKIVIHFLCADVDHNDANDDMLMIRRDP